MIVRKTGKGHGQSESDSQSGGGGGGEFAVSRAYKYIYTIYLKTLKTFEKELSICEETR